MIYLSLWNDTLFSAILKKWNIDSVHEFYIQSESAWVYLLCCESRGTMLLYKYVNSSFDARKRYKIIRVGNGLLVVSIWSACVFIILISVAEYWFAEFVPLYYGLMLTPFCFIVQILGNFLELFKENFWLTTWSRVISFCKTRELLWNLEGLFLVRERSDRLCSTSSTCKLFHCVMVGLAGCCWCFHCCFSLAAWDAWIDFHRSRNFIIIVFHY